jgi:hypothetical protein
VSAPTDLSNNNQLSLHAAKESIAPVEHSRFHTLHDILKIDLEGHVRRCTSLHTCNGKNNILEGQISKIPDGNFSFTSLCPRYIVSTEIRQSYMRPMT